MTDDWVRRGPRVHGTTCAILESAKLLQQTKELLERAEAVIRFRSDYEVVRRDLDETFARLKSSTLEARERAKLLHQLKDLLIEADQLGPRQV